MQLLVSLNFTSEFIMMISNTAVVTEKDDLTNYFVLCRIFSCGFCNKKFI